MINDFTRYFINIFNHINKIDIICIMFIVAYIFLTNKFNDRNYGATFFTSFKDYIYIFKVNGAYDFMSVLVYVILPGIIAMRLSYIRNIDPKLSENISVIMSIIIGMLFTLLSKVQEYKSKILECHRFKLSGNKYNLVLNVTNETLYVITFLITLSAISLILLLIVMFLDLYDSGIILSFLIYYSIIMVIFNLMTIMKRFNNLSKEIEDINIKEQQ